MKDNLVLEDLLYNKIGIYNISYFKKNNRSKLYTKKDMNNISIKYSDSFILSDIKQKELIVFTKQIKKFLLKMYSLCYNFKGDIFMSNFKDTVFDISDMSSVEKQFTDCCGFFSLDEYGKILYIGEFKAIFHELLHMTSETYKNDSSYKFNVAETEGYTQLLAKRYFPKETLDSYEFSTYLMEQIEKLFGRNILEREYFNGTFREYLNINLLKYGSFIQIRTLKKNINMLDYLYYQLTEDMSISKTNLILKKIKIMYINSMDIISQLFVNKIMRILSIEEREKMIKKLDLIVDESITFYPPKGEKLIIEYNNRDIINNTLKKTNKRVNL